MAHPSGRTLPVVVVVATHDRPALLRERSLPSIIAQTRTPDHVFVIDDSSSARFADIEAIARSVLTGGDRGSVFRNERSRGAAGAWNTGIAQARKRFGQCWVAILDDDDAWAPGHVEACLAAARPSTDAVVSGIQLCKDGVLKPWSPPAPLEWRAFLRGNPGWQGSNTFVRLNRLEECGGFDEAMPSTHDRDLAIRLLRLPGFECTQTGTCTVTYFLDRDRPALTTPRSVQKRVGLAAFWAKHAHLMDASDREAFLSRAERLFGFTAEDLGVSV